MGLAFKQFKTYARIAVMVVVGAAVLLVVFMNRNHKVDVWLFHTFPQTNVLWVMLISGASAVLIAWALRRVRQVFRDLREIRQAKALEAKMKQQQKLAEDLKAQESRIDQKIQGAIGQTEDTTAQS